MTTLKEVVKENWYVGEIDSYPVYGILSSWYIFSFHHF